MTAPSVDIADAGITTEDVAAFLAAEFNAFANTNLGGDVVIRGASAQGTELTVEIRITSVRRRYPDGIGRTVAPGFVCGGPPLDGFIALGGSVRMAFYGRSSGLENTYTVTSC